MSKFYADTKIFHFHDRLAVVEEGGIPAPIHIRLKTTNKCNHRCSYCCYRNDNLFLSQLMDEKDQIPTGKMAELIDDFSAMGVKAITFSGGGEPLIYPYIHETIEGLVRAGIKVAMLSNGGLLRGATAELLAREATWLRVSMDAVDSEGYAASRRVGKDEFAKVCRNIKDFADIRERKCVLGINLIVTRENNGKVLDFLKMSKDLGVDHVKVSGVVVSTKPQENDQYHLPIYDAVRDQLDIALATLVDENYGVVDLFHKPESKKEMYVKDYKWCPMSRFLIVIAADQNVYTCQDKAYTASGLIGSIKDISFKKLWQSPATAERLKALDPSKECRHHCVANNKNLMLLDYFSADPEHLDFV